MTRTRTSFKSIAVLSAALGAWTIFAAYSLQASALPMIEAVKSMA